jgi:hypothetical protein
MNKNPNLENLKPFQPGQSGNPAGKPKGSQNRSTIAKQVLSMMVPIPNDIRKALAAIYPDLPEKVTVEYLGTLSVMRKAIKKGSYLHYKAIQDSAYGAPKQEVEHSGEVEIGFDIGKISDDDLETILSITQKAKGATTD